MKKTLLTLAVTAALGFAASPQAAAELTFTEQDRSAWAITGCSERNHQDDATDGAYDEMKDGNTTTFWHSDYTNNDQHHNACPHYFVIDRGATDAGKTVGGFGYLPRQIANGNGFVARYRLYIVNNIDGLKVAKADAEKTKAFIDDDHSSLTTFLAGKTPVSSGNLFCANGNEASHNLKQIAFESPVAGQYVVFVIDATDGQGVNQHGNCAEFYLYDVTGTPNIPEINSSVYFYSAVREGNNRVFIEYDSNERLCSTTDGAVTDKCEFKLIPAEGDGNYKIYNVKSKKYVGAPASNVGDGSTNNKRICLYTLEGDAGVYNITYDAGGRAKIKSTANNTYWHSAESGNNWNVIPYGQDLWYIADWAHNSDEDRTMLRSNWSKIENFISAKAAAAGLLVTNVSQISVNSQESSGGEGVIGSMFDDNEDTYFHSGWSDGESVSKTENHWFAFSFANEDGNKSYTFNYVSRKNNEKSRATAISVFGSSDGGTTWSESPVAQLSEGLGLERGTVNFTTETVCNALKFVVTGANNTGFGNVTVPFYCYAEIGLSKQVSQEMLDALNEYLSTISIYSDDYAIVSELLRTGKYAEENYAGNLVFPPLNGRTVSEVFIVGGSTTVGDLLDNLTLPLAFTPDPQVVNQVITENGDVYVPGKWAYPAIEFGRVYRIAMRNRNNESNKYFYANTSDNTINTRDAVREDALTPERLFYFKDAGSDANTVRVTLHTIAKEGSYGFTCGTANNEQGSISNEPMTFEVVSNLCSDYEITSAMYVFSLKHLGTNSGHLNDISGKLGVWTDGGSRNDNGSAFRLYALTEDEINAVADAPANVKEAAIANPTVENITLLCRYAIKAEAPLVHDAIISNNRSGIGTDDNSVELPGYISSNSDEAKAVLAGLSDDMYALAQKIGALKLAKDFNATDGTLFVIKSTDDSRGYLRSADGSDYAVTTKTLSIANSDVEPQDYAYHFAFITVGEGDDAKKYLYNLGADRFMNAFGEKTDEPYASTAASADYTWRFNEVATPIKQVIAFKADVAHSFALLAGLDPTNAWTSAKHEGGLSLVETERQRPALVTCGFTNRTDGNGLIATYAGQLTDDQLQKLRERIAAAHAKVAADEADIPSGISEENHIVNHYTPATVDRIKAETSTPDYKHYLLENGERQGFVDNMVYTFINANKQALGFDDNGNQIEDGNFESCNTEAARAFFYWNAVPVTTSGEESVAAQALDATVTYRFTHEHDKTLKEMTLNGLTQHELGTSTLGKVTLNGVDYKVTSYSGKAVTTEIDEITAESNRGADVIFDLQGRRVNKAAKGVYIINGKKMLVK